jgi:hypothetical protein
MNGKIAMGAWSSHWPGLSGSIGSSLRFQNGLLNNFKVESSLPNRAPPGLCKNGESIP